MKSWYFDIERVPQGNNHGCGIACVATICGVTYPRARSEFFPKQTKFVDDNRLCVDGSEMVEASRRLGFDAFISDDFRSHGRPAILTFAWFPGSKTTGIHAIVWNPFTKKFIDPGWDHARFLTRSFYERKWKSSKFAAVIVTGKTRT